MKSKCGVAPRIRHPRQITGLELSGLGRALRRQRQLEAAGHAEDDHVLDRDLGQLQRIDGAGHQALGDEVVEAGGHDGKAEPRRPLRSFDDPHSEQILSGRTRRSRVTRRARATWR
jgi:hypothetical protein